MNDDDDDDQHRTSHKPLSSSSSSPVPASIPVPVSSLPSPTTSGQPFDGNEKSCGAGVSASQEFRQNHSAASQHHRLPPQPHELTAEWTVRARLTFARAGEKVQREFSTNDPLNPVRVIYKWRTLDPTGNDGDGDDDDVEQHGEQMTGEGVDKDTTSSTVINQKRHPSTSSKPSGRAPRRHESFRSTNSSNTYNADCGGADSAFSGSTASKSQRKSHGGVESSIGGSGGVGGRGRLRGQTGGSQTTTPQYGTRCRSTCNIVVSAVADFLPPDAMTAAAGISTAGGGQDNMTTAANSTTSGMDFFQRAEEVEESDPFVYNTTASYTVLPQKSLDGSTKSFRSSFGKVLSLRDNFSQTSDTETKYFEEKRKASLNRSPLGTFSAQNYRAYDYRRPTADNLLQSFGSRQGAAAADEGRSFMPSYTPSPTQTFKSASMSRLPQMSSSSHLPPDYGGQFHHQPRSRKNSASESQKKPRTVHIDVYCTGSEEDEQADVEMSSSSSLDDDFRRSGGGGGGGVDDDNNSGSRWRDVDSNSTPQTVLDNEQMRLRHHRVSGHALPRRLTQQQDQQHPMKAGGLAGSQQTNLSSQTDLQLGHAITKSSTAEEVSESKQLLFRKHIGDQRAVKLANLRQKYIRQTSEDALSSNYPNSSRSTMRDATCSSISSAVTSMQADVLDSSWKETAEEGDDVPPVTIGKSDSFDYDNHIDRLRIRQMERFWSVGGIGAGTSSGLSSDEQMAARSDSTRPSPPQGGHPLQPISEGNSHSNSPFSTSFQRNDTMPSESENFSETNEAVQSNSTTHPHPHPQTYPSPSQPQPRAPYFHQTSHFPRNRPGFLQFFGPHAQQQSTPNATTTAAIATHQSPKIIADASSLSKVPLPNQPKQQQQQQQQQQRQPQQAPTTAITTASTLYPNYQPNLQRWKSETRDNLSAHATPSPTDDQHSSDHSMLASPESQYRLSARCASEAPPTTTSANICPSPVPPCTVVAVRRFDLIRHSPSASETSTVLSGYTSEYLEKARIFGKVIAARKPGHHVGPTKNPNCSCESCQRWLAERFQLRGRAFSLGERPSLKRPTA